MNATVACAGELLWDVLPSHRVLGGAPANVAYHLSRLGCDSRLITRVGADERGDAAIRMLGDRGMRTTDIQVDRTLPTGAAYVQLQNAQATYEFETPAAWDAIEPPVTSVDAVVFGTLGQRDPRSAATIRNLVRGAPASFYDVNLRAPYTTFDIVIESLQLATVVKVNDAEIAALASVFGLPTQPPDFAAAIASRFPAHTICVSLGANGAGLWSGGRWIELRAPSIVVADTIGAGDAFFAGLVEGILSARPADEALSRAVALGSFVATRSGATPEYDAKDLGL
jgi:fructokinase